jgi:hypothetical protein
VAIVRTNETLEKEYGISGDSEVRKFNARSEAVEAHRVVRR